MLVLYAPSAVASCTVRYTFAYVLSHDSNWIHMLHERVFIVLGLGYTNAGMCEGIDTSHE